MDGLSFAPGERIIHPDLGIGVVIDVAREGYLRAFFSSGERRVPLSSIRREISRTERMARAVEGTPNAPAPSGYRTKPMSCR